MTPKILRIRRPKHIEILKEFNRLINSSDYDGHINKVKLFKSIRDKLGVNTPMIGQVVQKMKKEYQSVLILYIADFPVLRVQNLGVISVMLSLAFLGSTINLFCYL